ncbi:MAG: helix-turn-helix domain-containing protein [Ruminococcus sp.]|nr:helix-turn-helix domain-containing protein [Ruminococcus sp.]
MYAIEAMSMIAKDTVKRNRHYRCLEYDHDQTGDICLIACGIERCDPGISFGPELRDCYHLHAVLSGTGTLYAGGKEFHPHVGQLFLLKDNEVVQYTADKKDPWCYCWVTYNGIEAKKLSEEIGFTDGVYCIDSKIDTYRFYELVTKMHEKPQMNHINDLRRRGILLEYLAMAMEASANSAAEHKYEYSTEVYIQRAQNLINLNYATIRVSDVVEYIGFTRSYFTTIFTKAVGMSPQEYIIKCRLENSAKLLTHTKLSVQTIASKVGYDDQLTFSRIFRRHYGVSPTGYRAQQDEQKG